ncbi:elongation factor P 5-aminopentanone reductase [Desmospora activa]|uniref:3-oxoacyl-[acyl-carrier protein] reductase n=1 Tax=Desmospora activa DSM 45169 TaxID=1121389 RepID=A0A2T4ZAN1_9BACL|nr:3-oxoacyl-ACP reductase FabG [Desmospora activa]PTM58927.1 3-oxoacyl-[acyl-carrier protein] reductase [Desmospora activa DSM 45169]
MNKDLANQIAFISGGSRGIGAAVAKALADAGADVAINYNRSHQQAERVADRCRKKGVKAITVQGDVRFRSQVEAMVDQVEQAWGAPALLVHSAGVVGESDVFQLVDDEEYDRVMDVHVRGAFFLIRRLLPDMVRNRYGRIIILSSVWGESGGAGEVLYSTAKGALNGLVRSLGKETAPSGITVNAVAPGAIRTEMLDQQLTTVEQHALATDIPVGRLGEPAEVASLVRWLCERQAAYVTGQVFHIDGGWTV